MSINKATVESIAGYLIYSIHRPKTCVSCGFSLRIKDTTASLSFPQYAHIRLRNENGKKKNKI